MMNDHEQCLGCGGSANHSHNRSSLLSHQSSRNEMVAINAGRDFQLPSPLPGHRWEETPSQDSATMPPETACTAVTKPSVCTHGNLSQRKADPSSHKNYKRVPVLVNLLLVAVAKHQTGSYLRKEGFHLADSLRVQSILVGRAWQQEQKVAGHMAFTVGKRKEMEASAELASSFVFGLRLLQCNGVTHNYSGSSHLK